MKSPAHKSKLNEKTATIRKEIECLRDELRRLFNVPKDREKPKQSPSKLHVALVLAQWMASGSVG